MFECPECLIKLIGPSVVNNKMVYVCSFCEKYWSVKHLQHMLMLSTPYIQKISKEVLSSSTAGDKNVISYI